MKKLAVLQVTIFAGSFKSQLIDYFRGHVTSCPKQVSFMLIRTKWRLCMPWRHFGWTLWRSQLLCSWRNFYSYVFSPVTSLATVEKEGLTFFRSVFVSLVGKAGLHVLRKWNKCAANKRFSTFYWCNSHPKEKDHRPPSNRNRRFGLNKTTVKVNGLGAPPYCLFNPIDSMHFNGTIMSGSYLLNLYCVIIFLTIL